MSSNFYTSTHASYWLLSRSAMHASRETDLKYATAQQLYCLNIFFASLIQKLGKRLMLRQVPIATATVFFRRFYTKSSVCETNPYLVLAACVFVAAKVEETPVHIKSVVAEAKVVFAEHNIKMFPAESHKLGEMEFYLLEDLDFHLVVFHPYRALVNICGREPADAGRFPLSRVEEDAALRRSDTTGVNPTTGSNGAGVSKATPIDDAEGAGDAERIRRLMGRGSAEGLMEIDEGTLQIAWFTITDTYRTDVPLLYPPYVIALAALYIAFTLTSMSSTAARTRSSSQINTLASSIESNAALGLPPPPTSAAEFLASFEVSLPVLFACVQDIICLYPIWEAFEPTNKPTGVGGAGAAAGSGATGSTTGGSIMGGGQGTTMAAAVAAAQKVSTTKNRFGPEDAEALVRKMIEERMVDVGHPADAGKSAGEPSKKRARG